MSARLTGDLARWRGRVARFAAVPAGWTVSGTADVIAAAQVRPDRTFSVTGGGKLDRFALADGRGGQVADAALDLTLAATGRMAETAGGPVRVDTGELVLVAGPDRAELTLLAPVADAARLSSGTVSARLTGDIGRWRARAGTFAPIPAAWTVGGTGTAAADLRFAPDAYRADNVAVDIKDVKFVGLGLNVDELEVITNCGVVADRNTGTVTVTDMKLSSTSVSLATRSIELTPTADGGLTGKGTVAVVAKIDRVLRTAGVAVSDPALAPSGTATGTVGFALGRGGLLTFDATGKVTDLVVGPPADPTWAEPAVDVAAKGDWDTASGDLRLASAHAGRDGLAVDTRGTVTDMTHTAGLNLDGTIAYDLAKLEPTLRKFLGQGTTVRGSGRRPFAVRGPLYGPADRMALRVGGSPPVNGRPPFTPASRTPTIPAATTGPLTDLTGSASVEWDALRTFGFDVGPEELSATLGDGKLAMTPIDAEFGGGRVRVTPTLDVASPNYAMTFAPGRVVDKAKLTPDALDGTLGALGYALPAFADVAQAEGTVSFDLADGARVPLTDVAKTSLTGNLTVHSAQGLAGAAGVRDPHPVERRPGRPDDVRRAGRAGRHQGRVRLPRRVHHDGREDGRDHQGGGRHGRENVPRSRHPVPAEVGRRDVPEQPPDPRRPAQAGHQVAGHRDDGPAEVRAGGVPESDRRDHPERDPRGDPGPARRFARRRGWTSDRADVLSPSPLGGEGLGVRGCGRKQAMT